MLLHHDFNGAARATCVANTVLVSGLCCVPYFDRGAADKANDATLATTHVERIAINLFHFVVWTNRAMATICPRFDGALQPSTPPCRYAKAQALAEAERAYEEMVSDGIEPNAITLSHMAIAQAWGSSPDMYRSDVRCRVQYQVKYLLRKGRFSSENKEYKMLDRKWCW